MQLMAAPSISGWIGELYTRNPAPHRMQRADAHPSPLFHAPSWCPRSLAENAAIRCKAVS